MCESASMKSIQHIVVLAHYNIFHSIATTKMIWLLAVINHTTISMWYIYWVLHCNNTRFVGISLCLQKDHFIRSIYDAKTGTNEILQPIPEVLFQPGAPVLLLAAGHQHAQITLVVGVYNAANQRRDCTRFCLSFNCE